MSDIAVDEPDHFGDTYEATVVPMMQVEDDTPAEIFPLDGLEVSLVACYNCKENEVKGGVTNINLATSEVDVIVSSDDPTAKMGETEYRLKAVLPQQGSTERRVETIAVWKVPRI